MIAPAGAVEFQIDGRTVDLPVDLPVCGGALKLACGSDQWCDYPDEHACGADDTFGTCRVRVSAGGLTGVRSEVGVGMPVASRPRDRMPVPDLSIVLPGHGAKAL